MAELTAYQRIQQLLSPKPHLHPEIFYNNNMMQSEVRQILLNKAMDVYNKIYAPFQGISLKDIFLVGSSASYQWTQKSDFDLELLIKIDYDKFFIHHPKQAQEFLMKLYQEHRSKERTYRYNELWVDVRPRLKYPQALHGVYSLLYNSWPYIPSYEIMLGLKADEIYQLHLQKVFEIKQWLNVDFAQMSHKQKMQTIKKLRQKHKTIYNKQFLNAKEHTVYKSLKFVKMQKEIINFCSDNATAILSIGGEEQ